MVTEDMVKELLSNIENKCRESREKRTELNRLKEHLIVKKCKDEIIISKEEIDDTDEIELEVEEDEELNYYLNNYKSLYDEFTYNDIKSVLPSVDNYNYKNIMLRLIAESYKEIKDINEVISEEEDITTEELKEYKCLIEKEKTKIYYLKEELYNDNNLEEEKEEIKNNIVLVPTIGGNIRVIDELEHIASEYYDSFLELINSIIDGTFKNVKIFTGNKELIGISEVKGFKTRVVFSRLDNNNYALITAFVKKSDSDKFYKETLIRKVSHYKDNEAILKEKIKDESFMEENSLNVDRLFNLINPKDDKKVLVNE